MGASLSWILGLPAELRIAVCGYSSTEQRSLARSIPAAIVVMESWR